MKTEQTAWWRFGHVWLLMAGPALVVVAALVTAWIAISHPDPLLTEGEGRPGLESNKRLPPEVERSRMPAQQARNHAATPADVPVHRAP